MKKVLTIGLLVLMAVSAMAQNYVTIDGVGYKGITKEEVSPNGDPYMSTSYEGWTSHGKDTFIVNIYYIIKNNGHANYILQGWKHSLAQIGDYFERDDDEYLDYIEDMMINPFSRVFPANKDGTHPNIVNAFYEIIWPNGETCLIFVDHAFSDVQIWSGLWK